MIAAITFANVSTLPCLLFALSLTVEASSSHAAAFVTDSRRRLISKRLSTKIKSAPFEALENDILADPMNGQFIEWLNRKGCFTNSVRINFNELGLRGLCANRAISKGEIIASIPYAAALPVGNTMLDGYHGELLMEEFKNDGVLDEIDLRNYNADDVYDALQGLKFLRETMQNPEWKPYVDSLPEVPTIGDEAGLTPDFWSKEVIMEIQIHSFVTRTLQRKHLVEKIATAAKINDRELRWATWMIRSRRFSIIDFVYEESPSSGKRYSLLEWLSSRITKKDVVKGYLLPMLDMSNHSSHPNASIAIKIDKFARKFEESSSFVLRATTDVEKNEELTISYLDGDGTSLDLLDKYGFFTEDNPNDEILLAKLIPSIPTTLEDDEEKQREIDTSVVENGSISAVMSLRMSLKKRAGSRI